MSESEEDSTNNQIKITLLGDPSVGKTCIIRRFCYDEFSRQYTSTIGADFHIKRKYLPAGKEIVLKISDIGGLELSGNMLDKYLFNSNVCLLNNALIGNKCDMEHQRAVRLDRTKQFAEQHKLTSYSMSARTGESVTFCIMELVARHLGIRFSRVEKEKQHKIVRAELSTGQHNNLMPDAEYVSHGPHVESSTTVCNVQ
ncbi:Rab10 [Carabus blaptoides fortunei]